MAISNGAVTCPLLFGWGDCACTYVEEWTKNRAPVIEEIIKKADRHKDKHPILFKLAHLGKVI